MDEEIPFLNRQTPETRAQYAREQSRDLQRELVRKILRTALAIAAATLLVAIWLLRWQAIEVHPATGRGSMYLLNRITGEVRWVFDDEDMAVKRPSP